MSQTNSNIKSKKFKQIKFRERVKIETLLETGYQVLGIAKEIGLEKNQVWNGIWIV